MNIPFSFTSQREKWIEKLRATAAVHELRRARPDKVPLPELRAVTDAVLAWKKLAPISEECDALFLTYLAELKGELYVHHAGIIACVHALTPDTAWNLILSVKPDHTTEPTDVYFEYRVSAYLGTIIASRKVDNTIISERVFYAAIDMLRAMQSVKGGFPSIKYLLRPIGEDILEEFIPTALIRTILVRIKYKERLQDELNRLTQRREWIEAHRLVGFLKDLRRRQHCLIILPQVIPDQQRWMAWDPNIERIKLWDIWLRSQEHREHLDQFLALEGPDISAQGLPTARQSPHAIQMLRLPSQPPGILDEALYLLDLAVTSGRHVMDLYIYFIVHQGRLSSREIDRVRLCLATGYDEQTRNYAAEQLVVFHKSITYASDQNLEAETLTSVLPIFTASPQLQAAFGIDSVDFASRVWNTLKGVQVELCLQFQRNDIHAISWLALRICALGCVLKDAAWLFDYWTSEYLALIRQLPPKSEVQNMIGGLEKASGDARQWQIDDLADRVGFSPRRGHVTAPLPPPSSISPHPPEDPIWDENKPLDGDRTLLRSQVLTTIRETAPDLATACLKQSKHEPDTFISELLRRLPGNTNSDVICVNLAEFLGPRDALGRKVNDVWKLLLMHMMRSLPPGILDRCAATLRREKLKSWLQNLRQLYGRRYLEPEGNLGITEEKIQACKMQMRGMIRSVSARTQGTVTAVSTTNTSRIT